MEQFDRMQWIGVATNLVIFARILVSKLPRMEAHLCARNNSYLIFVRNFQKMNRYGVLKKEPERRSGAFRSNSNPAVTVG